MIELTANKITYFCFLDKDYLHEQYVVLGKSMNQIAREKGCARSTVGAALLELGLGRQNKSSLRCNKGQIAFGERILHGRIVRCQSEHRIIKQMAAMRVAGDSYGQIALALNASQVKSKNRKSQWSRTAIYKILKRFSDSAKENLNSLGGPKC